MSPEYLKINHESLWKLHTQKSGMHSQRVDYLILFENGSEDAVKGQYFHLCDDESCIPERLSYNPNGI